MIHINLWQSRICGEYLASVHKAMVESDMREAERECQRVYQRELQKEERRIREKEEEEEIRRKDPHCTWMFNHFDYGNEWIYYKTLY